MPTAPADRGHGCIPPTGSCIGPVAFSTDELDALSGRTYEDIRTGLAPFPRWTHYVIGVALVLAAPRRDRSAAGAARDQFGSATPRSAWRRARRSRWPPRARWGPAPLTLLAWPRCVRRRRTTWSAHRAGSWTRSRWRSVTPGSVLPILCRPASAAAPVALPDGPRDRRLADRDSARRRRGALRAGPGGRLHGQAHGGGRGGTYLVLGEPAPTRCRRRTPGRARRRDLPGRSGDRPVTTSRRSDPTRRIRSGPPRCSASRNMSRAVAALAALASGELDQPRAIDGGQPCGVRRHGFGPHGRDAHRARRPWTDPACFGARSSGGGCGGTVVVVCERGALDDVEALIR